MTPTLEELVPYLIQKLGALQVDLLASQWQVNTLSARVAELEREAADAAE